MEHNFHQPNHAGVVDLNSWDFAFACHNRQGQALEQSEIDMPIESLSLESTEAVSDLTEDLTHGGEVIERFLQMKVSEVVACHFASEESEKLLVLFDKGVLEVGSQDVMTVVDPLQGCMQLALEVFSDALTEERRDLSALRSKSPSSQERLKRFWIGKWRLKMKLRQYSIWLMA